MSVSERLRVRSRFDRAAAGYDAAAVLQREVCHRLLGVLPTVLPENPNSTPRLIDAGCGTGYGARLLHDRWPQAHIVAADFSLRMAAAAAKSIPSATMGASIVADIEAVPLASSTCDGFWSSLAVQWCDLPRVMREAARVLDTHGWLALSTLGEGTYAELRSAFSQVDQYTHTLSFSSTEQLQRVAALAGLSEVRCERANITLHYPDVRALLGAVKAIGANALGAGRRPGMMGKVAWQRLTTAYEAHRTTAGLPASYDVILLTAKK